MANKPAVILDHFRRIEEISRTGGPGTPSRAGRRSVGQGNEPMPAEEFDRAAPSAFAVITAHWHYGSIDDMPKLKAIMEVGGRHPSPKVLDYPACFARGIRVLSCAPAFGPMVAEMALGLTIASARDRRRPHRLPRGQGDLLHKSNKNAFHPLRTDGRLHRLWRPGAQPQAYAGPLRLQDPGSSTPGCPHLSAEQGVEPVSLEHLLQTSRVIYVLAIPSAENRLARPGKGWAPFLQDAVLVLISRSHLVDFDALTELLHARRFKAAIDVFPQEPPPLDHPIRTAPRRNDPLRASRRLRPP